MSTEHVPALPPAGDVLRRTGMLRASRGLAVALPDFLMAVIFAMAVALPTQPYEWARAAAAALDRAADALGTGLLIEASFLLFQATVIDVATRLRRRPPIWALPVVGGMVLMLFPQTWPAVVNAWKAGAVVLLPLLLSLFDRLAVLWRMPQRTVVEKMAARALIGNRIVSAVGVAVAFVGVMVAEISGLVEDMTGPVFLSAIALYFAVGAFDEWRVRRPRFAARPRVLFGFDVLGVKYLHEV